MDAPSAPAEKIILVGAAHVVDTAASVRSRLSGQRLQAIALELDPERAQILSESAGGAPPPARTGPALIRLWSVLQRRLGHQLGQGAGAEMRAGARLGREWNLPVFLIDDPFRQTVGRLLGSLRPSERLRLVAGAILGLFIPPRAVRRELVHYAEAPADYLAEIRHQFPSVARVLLDERNEHMADRLEALWAQGFRRVAVLVGDAHVAGLAASLRRRNLPVETIEFRELQGGATPAATGP
jgi:pheromone shutdown protein TraB